MKKEAVALCRVSSAEQRVEGSSLDSQLKHVREFANSFLNCEIDEGTVDKPRGLWSLDVSSKAGKNIKRKDLLEIRQYCREHKYIKYFVVDKVNRLMREIKMFYWFIQELENINVKTYFADPQQQDLNKDDPVAQLKTFLAIYEAERDNKERANTTITRMKDKVLDRYYIFPLHQGYKTSSIKGVAEPDEPYFSLLQSAARNIISGRLTPSESLVDLKKRGYRTHSGKELRIDKFKDILTDDYYAGLITIDTWAKEDERFRGIKGLHEAMITEEEHLELKSIILGKKRFSERRKDRKEFPLGNIGLCECGGRLVGFIHSNGKGWNSPKYRCRSCGKQFHAEIIHMSLDDKFKTLRFNRSEEGEFVELLTKVWNEEEQNTVQRIKVFKQKKDLLELEKAQVVRKLATNNDPGFEEDFKATLQSIKDEIDKAEEEIRELSTCEADMVDFIRFSLKFLDGKIELWRKLDRNQRVRCKQLLFPGEIVVNSAEKVCTPQISPILCSIHDIEGAEKPQKSKVVELRGVAPLSKR